jgi:membrane protein DedA with SNARE-associated domain
VVVFAAVVFDGLIPLVPAEATIIAASVLAANGTLSPVAIFAAAAAGAAVGDNVSYWLGRGVGPAAARRLFAGEKGRARLTWARCLIDRRTWLVTIGRFVPGGRTATTLAAGLLEVRWRRFAAWDALGAALWAAYAEALGYFGGSAFRHSLWRPLAVSLAVGAIVALAVEAGRRWSQRGRWRAGRLRTGAHG